MPIYIQVISFSNAISVEELSGAVVSRLDFYVGDPGSIPAGAEFPTGI